MWFVVGLGNPGAPYEGTRHNIGFDVVDALARRHGFETFQTWKTVQVAKGQLNHESVYLVKPQTFMNLSGMAVGKLLQYHKGMSSNVIVIHDELDFAPGQVRLKAGGGHGGHKGICSLISQIGKDFLRVRVGIGKPLHADQGADYVLRRFDKKTRLRMDEAVVVAGEAVQTIVAKGIEQAMQVFHRSYPGSYPAS